MKSSMIIHPDELSKTWIDRLADASIGTLGIHPCGGKDAATSLSSLLDMMKTAEFRELIDYAHSRGIEVEYEIHAASYLLPRQLFESHSEYFRVNENGIRTNDHNFCVSNEAAIDLFAKRSAELALMLYGSCHNFYFWMDDGHNLQCHCSKCKNLSPSDQQMLVLNRILKEIREYLPDACVSYLAYMDTVVPPQKIGADDGIFLEYAPFQKYTAKGENSCELIHCEKLMIKPLLDFFAKGQKKVLEYWYDNSLFSNWKKPAKKFVLNEKSMQQDISEYRRMGFDIISTFACFLGKDYEEMHGSFDITPFAESFV